MTTPTRSLLHGLQHLHYIPTVPAHSAHYLQRALTTSTSIAFPVDTPSSDTILKRLARRYRRMEAGVQIRPRNHCTNIIYYCYWRDQTLRQYWQKRRVKSRSPMYTTITIIEVASRARAVNLELTKSVHFLNLRALHQGA